MIECLSTIASIERLNAIASLITLANVVALSGLIFKLTREWKEAREAQYKSELTGKDRMIEQAEARHKSEIAEKEWVIKQAEVQHKNELAEKDRTIDQLREKTYEDAGQEETLLRNMISYRNDDLKKLRVELNKTRLG